jgi:hypothetical protein
VKTSLCVALLLIACAPEPDKKPERGPKLATRPSTPAPAPAPTPEPEPPPAVDPGPALVPAPANVWWCLCYQREGGEGPEPVTACREDLEQCHKLEQRVSKGNKDIIAGSLSVGCRSISGSHPSDAAGTPEQWQPSQLRGAWVAEGVCLLNSVVAPSDPTPAPPPSEPTADPTAFMRSELIGDLAIGRSSAEIRSRHGEPVSMGAIEELAVTGEWEQVWTYADGLVVTMRSSTRSGPQSLAAVTIEAPSKLLTRRGVGVGDPRSAVERAYGDVAAPDAMPGSFIAGSVEAGLSFSFDQDGVVRRIRLGGVDE